MSDAADTSALATALITRDRRYGAALDRLREVAASNPDAENGAYDDAATLREALELVRCLRRLVGGQSAVEIHRAFGAPGDFGYDTPIGDALAAIYRVASQRSEP